MASLSEIVSYTDRFLRIREVGDWANALNGLQIENSGRIMRIGAAVDISTRVLSEAAKQNVDLLIVHHGLFWPGLQPIRGALRRQLRLAFEKDIALYSAHLPLDVHPKIGNNAQLVAALGLKSAQPFLEEKGQPVGLKIRASVPRTELVRKLQKALNGPGKSFRVRSETGARDRHRDRGRRLGDLPGGRGKYRHVYHRRSSALGRSCRRRTRHEFFARRALRDGSVWGKSARCASLETVQSAMGIYRLSNGVVRVFGVRGSVAALRIPDTSAAACAILSTQLCPPRPEIR